MLSTLTATQARCTEQEQRIRDQERELVELRGRQGAEELHVEQPMFQVLVDGEHFDDFDTEDSADRAARSQVESMSRGVVQVLEVRAEYVIEPARSRTVTKKRLGPNCITED
jgi:hypothetical protein